MCRVLDDLVSAVAAVSALPVPTGLGAGDVLAQRVAAVAASVADLQRDLAVLMSAQRREDPASDPKGAAVRAGVPQHQCTLLGKLGTFCDEHPAVGAAWAAGDATADQVAVLQDAAKRLPTPAMRASLVAAVLPHLKGLCRKQTRELVAATADLLNPGDPDAQERRDYDHRSLVWSEFAGGVSFQGYLPATEAAAFTAAIDALAAAQRAQGDGRSMAQRRADALAQLVATATANGIPAGGGLPAALTLIVPLAEAGRVAAKDPSRHGLEFATRTRGTATVGGRHAGDAAVRFGLCCAAITPVLVADPPPTGLLGRIAKTPVEPLLAGRSVRLATPAQRKALALRDGGCVIPGCTIAAPYTQPHHVTGWALDGPTDLPNLASLCFVHHRQVELGDWELIKRDPGDPRPHDRALEHPAWWILPRNP